MFIRKNLVLIGMPGCGKTAIGRIISRVLHMTFVDVDRYIESTENKTISELFSVSEEYFRDIESKCAKEIAGGFNKVICTGGGIIKRESNITNLKENSFVVFINRPIENIISDVDISTRPLLKDNKEKLYNLYNDRIDLYKKYCDIEVINDKDLEYIFKKIIYEFKKGANLYEDLSN